MTNARPRLLMNIMIAVFNGFVCGFNTAMLVTGNSSIPALTVALIVINGGMAVWMAKATLDRATSRYTEIARIV